MKRALAYNLRPFPKRARHAEPMPDAMSSKKVAASRSKKPSGHKNTKRRPKKPSNLPPPVPTPRLALAPSPSTTSPKVSSNRAVASDLPPVAASKFTAIEDQVRYSDESREINTSPASTSTSINGDTFDSNLQIYGVIDVALVKEDLEGRLRKELHDAVFVSRELLEEKLVMSDKAKLQRVMRSLRSKPFFQHSSSKASGVMSIDMMGFGKSRRCMYDKIAKMLNMINKAAFTRNHFRPKPGSIVNEKIHSLWALDAHYDDIPADLTRMDPINCAGILNLCWMDVEFFCECKKKPEELTNALLSLARYARSTYAHQLYRDHIYALAVCGNEATFVLFDRAKITHSEPINLETDCERFVEAAIGLFSLDAHHFGYDTRFSWFPAPTGEPGDRAVQRELRLNHNSADWQVVKVLYRHNKLLGRAPTIMRVRKVDDPDCCRVTKMAWRPLWLRPEAENLREFEGDEGIMQCFWSDEGRLTTADNLAIDPSPHQKRIASRRSSSRDRSISASALRLTESDKKPILETEAVEAQKKKPEEKQKDLIQMPEGVALSHIKCFVDLLIIMRDAIVGYAHLVQKGRIHRDVSVGNILCCIPKDPVRSKASGPASNLRSSRSRGVASSEADDYSFVSAYQFPVEKELSGVKTLEDYVQKRYQSSSAQTSVGKLSDLEYTIRVEPFQRGDTFNAREISGTWSFISGRLLQQAHRGYSRTEDFPHCYLDDLESFFWVLYWVIINHTKNGQERSEYAEMLITQLCGGHGETLGIQKELLIRGSLYRIKKLNNEWSQDAFELVGKFAEILNNQLYSSDAKDKFQMMYGLDKWAQKLRDSKPAVKPDDPWTVIKSVIDIFDQNILRLQRKD